MRASALFTIALAGFASSATIERRAVWQPQVGDTWQIILSRRINADVKLTPDVGIFDIDMENHSKATIKTLHDKGKKVICYFSAGSSEDWRADNDKLLPHTGAELDGWEGEKWLNTNAKEVRDVMVERIQRAADKGCDAIDPDNVDAYDNRNGLNLKQKDAIDYIKFLSKEATSRGMSISLKNAGAIVKDLLPYVHFSVQEECNEQKDCKDFEPFIKAGKPVFNIEYIDNEAGVKASCPSNKGFSSLLKYMNLDGRVTFCDGTSATTVTV